METTAPRAALSLRGDFLKLDWPSRGEEAVVPQSPPGVGDLWNFSHLGHLAAQPPVPIGEVSPAWTKDLPGSILDLCVRRPREQVSWPTEFASLLPLVAKVLPALAKADPTAEEEAYLYLTVDTRWVTTGSTQRRGGWHLDGLQGPRYRDQPKRVCHQILLYDTVPTGFALQPFDVRDIDVGRDNVFSFIGEQVHAESIQTWPEHTLLWTSAYHVHASMPSPVNCWRNFVRLEVSRKQADRLGNSVHPLLSRDWDWQPRPIPAGLRKPVTTI